MISDSELQIFTFRSDEWIGLLTQSDIAKSDGIKSDLTIRTKHTLGNYHTFAWCEL